MLVGFHHGFRRANPDSDNPGIELDELDPAVRPRDDLFRHVNGKWIARTEIPSDKARYGSFYVLAEEAEKAVRDIIEEAQERRPPAPRSARSATCTPASSTRSASRRAAGRAVAPDFDGDRRRSPTSRRSSRELGRLERLGTSGFLQAFVDNDPGDPERYLVFLEQGGLGLPDESYYRDEKFAEIRTAYRAHLERMLGMAGLSDAGDARPAGASTSRPRSPAHHWDNVRTRDSQATYNPMHWAEVEALAGSERGGLLAALARGARRAGRARSPRSSCASRASSRASPGCSTRTASTPGATGCAGRSSASSAPYLHAEVVQANFDFYGKTLTGTPELRARWKRGVSLVEGALGEAVGRIYVERHFSPEREDRDGRPGRQPRRGLPRQHRDARVDDPRDPRARAREARRSSRPRSATR